MAREVTDLPVQTTKPRQPRNWLPGLLFEIVGLSGVEPLTSRLSGVLQAPLRTTSHSIGSAIATRRYSKSARFVTGCVTHPGRWCGRV